MDDNFPCGATCRTKYFPKFSEPETFDIPKDIGLWVISVPKEHNIAFNLVTYSKIQIAAVRKGVNCNYGRAFCWEKRDLNSGVCSGLFSDC